MAIGRFFCTLIPFLLSLGTLVAIVLVFLGDTNASTSLPHNLHFFTIDMASFRYADDLNTASWYTIGLWNYCSGPSTQSPNDPTYCSPRTAFYHVDPVAAWNLNGTQYQDIIAPTGSADSYITGLGEYVKFNRICWILYIAAGISAAITFVLSGFACCSRLGSIFTSFFAGITALLMVAASAIATAVFLSLKAYVNEKLEGYGISGAIGESMFITTWLGAGFAVGASCTWVWTICCCAGGSGGARAKRRGVTRSQSYKRVPSPVFDVPGLAAPAMMQMPPPLQMRGRSPEGGFENYKQV